MEVAVALGLVSFCLISLIGLLSLGMQNDREASEDTRLAYASETVLSLLGNLGYTAVLADARFAAAEAGGDFFFDDDGNLFTDASGAPVTGATTGMSCRVNRVTPGAAPAGLLMLRLAFEWPLEAPPDARQERVLITALANDR